MAGCYIAGPMRGLPEYNYPAFMEAEKKLRELGWDPIYNPAAMDIEEDEEDYTARSIEEQELYDTAHAARRFARRDIDVLLNKLFAERGDAIILLPRWWTSIGAVAEWAVSRWVFLRRLRLADACASVKLHSTVDREVFNGSTD